MEGTFDGVEVIQGAGVGGESLHYFNSQELRRRTGSRSKDLLLSDLQLVGSTKSTPDRLFRHFWAGILGTRLTAI